MSRPKDRPERDPHVAELGGFDVTSLSVEQLRREGVQTGGLVTVAIGEHPAWKRHSEFLADDRPEWDLIDRGYARAAAAAHVRAALRDAAEHERRERPEAAATLRERPLAGLALPRSFPCLGMLRVQLKDDRAIVVTCDTCGESFGVNRPPEPSEEKPRRRRPRFEDKSDEWGF